MTVVARGHVRDRPFARTVYAIVVKRFTGDMIMTQGGHEYRVSWKDGQVVDADSSSPADSPGRVALTAGLVTSSQLADAMRLGTTAVGKSQLEVLAEVARLSAEQVLTIKRLVLAHRAMRIFALPDATLVLDSGTEPSGDPALLPLSGRWLIYQGLRNHYSEERLMAELATVQGAAFRLLQTSKPYLREYGFAAQVKAVLVELARRAMTAEELYQAFPQVTRKAILALLYSLLATDALKAAKRADDAAEPSAAAPAQGSVPPVASMIMQPQSERSPVPPGVPAAIAADQRSRPVRIPTEAAPVAARAAGQSSAPEPRRQRREPKPDPARADEIRQLIAAKLSQIESDADHYKILEVERDTGDVGIRRSYFELAKKLHPDRLRAAGVTDQASESQRVFARINEAFALLTNPQKRAQYDQVLQAGGARAVAAKERAAEEVATRVLTAEEHFRRGEMAVRREHWSDAVAEFQKAVSLNPKEGEYHALLAWSRWCLATNKDEVMSEVQKGLREAVALSPRNIASYLYRGRIASATGDLEQALEWFHQVLSREPSHQEASLQVRLLESRVSRGQSRKGLFPRRKDP